MGAPALGALVLAGGAARRMQGQNKALLRLKGRTFLERLAEAFDGFDERLISTNDASFAAGSPFVPVADRTPGRGPLEGLASALTVCKSDGLVVAACDMPLFSADLARFLAQAAQGHPAAACEDRAGRLHPLCGVYMKTCLPALDAALGQGRLRMMDAFFEIGGAAVPLGGTAFADSVLTNINTPDALAKLIDTP
ncbi:molybdenum cofactor guanylyltransferase [Anaerotruncus colihominis]|uniref:molybdenum cofactor guanylyltransferase n=1 Tax=Anaerotruncus colihominis TaxID=169435 RepID=UPI00174915BE|nr:molybdenum cofactor guanylyltransferase [Anaerotruncus colihominis]